MGNFCCFSGCCGQKPKKSTSQTKRLKELSPLKRAKLMKKTMNGKDINLQINTKFITKEQQNLLKNTTYELNVLLNEPYNVFSKITETLYLTGVGGINEENIKENKIKHIINVTYELPIYNVVGIECIKIPVDDDREEDLSIYFPEVTEKMIKWSNNRENTVVHCLCGVSRSVTIVLGMTLSIVRESNDKLFIQMIAYLMKSEKMDLRTAFRFVQQKRDLVRPNNAFFKQLIEFEKKLFKISTTKMIETEMNITMPDFGTQYPHFTTLNGDHSIDANYSESQSLVTLFSSSSIDNN